MSDRAGEIQLGKMSEIENREPIWPSKGKPMMNAYHVDIGVLETSSSMMDGIAQGLAPIRTLGNVKLDCMSEFKVDSFAFRLVLMCTGAEGRLPCI